MKIELSEYEIFRIPSWRPFEISSGFTVNLNTAPYLDIVLTDRCQSRCNFCVARLIHDKKTSCLEEQKDGIRYAIEEMGVNEVLLLGGEPTIHPQLFEYVDWLKQFNLDKICMTTNGLRMATQPAFAEKVFSSGITHLNISVMNLRASEAMSISNAAECVAIRDLARFWLLAEKDGVKIRINNNVFRGNNDNLDSLENFYWAVEGYCHSVKFSPLLKTDRFSVINTVNDWIKRHILSDQEYDRLWANVIDRFSDEIFISNPNVLGFVEYAMILMETPLILNYNQHNRFLKEAVEKNRYNSVKMLPTGDLSLSWNREEPDYFIKVG